MVSAVFMELIYQQPCSAEWNTFTSQNILIESEINVPFARALCFNKKAWIYCQAKGCLLSCGGLLISRLLASAGCCFQPSSVCWSHCASAKTLLWNETPQSRLGCHLFSIGLAKIQSECLRFYHYCFLSDSEWRSEQDLSCCLTPSLIDLRIAELGHLSIEMLVMNERHGGWWREAESELLWFVCFWVSTGREESLFSLGFDTVLIHYTAGLNPIS